MSEIVSELTAAYDKVKEWPENSETGFMDLLALRNLVPEAIAELDRLREALEFYANPEIYKPHPHGPAFDRRDLSYHARAALSPDNSTQKKEG